MSFAVYHVEKGSSNSGGIGNHIDRKEGAEHTYPHADPNRRSQNIHFKVDENRQRMPLSKAISDRIEKGYNGKRKIRTDAVKYMTHILTGSHEKMKEIFADKEKSQKWLKANYDFLKSEFGEKNIVRFTLHMDEKTPHIHAVTIPLTDDGRLSAREVIGNRKDMQSRQDRYAEQMQGFGLERGLRRTGVKHENAKEYYTRISKETISDDLSDYKRPLIKGGGLDKEKLRDALTTAKISLEDKVDKLNQQKKKIDGYNKDKEKQTKMIERQNLLIKGMVKNSNREIFIKTQFKQYERELKQEIKRQPIFSQNKIENTHVNQSKRIKIALEALDRRERGFDAEFVKNLINNLNPEKQKEILDFAGKTIQKHNEDIDRVNSRNRDRGFDR